MRNLSLYVVLALTVSPAFGAQYHNLKALSNSGLQTAMLTTSQAGAFTKAVKIDQLPASGKKSKAEIRQGTVAQILHATCEFFDDGVGLSQVDGDPKSIATAVNAFVDDNADNSEAVKAQLKDDLLKAERAGKIEIYSGNASGNNTSGTVLGVYDLDNDEVLGSAFTNCGSDD